ncbi:MAG TPA: RnfABCDGE type electron transport complex subunit D [Candidatus Latescibacteria bacterium]|nr:RnfABCDGE type electron transport complex subunit D [Candidatus Latescibacterota bacterium]
MQQQRVVVSVSPHIVTSVTVSRLMYMVVLALIPAAAVSLYFFRLKAALLITICVITALLTEALLQKARGKAITVDDGSALLTGLLLALNLPPSMPLWAAILGTVVAIGLGKQIFGGLGYNIFNPALVGRAFLSATFPVLMTTWTRPLAWSRLPVDATTVATPLGLMKFEHFRTSYLKLLEGNVSGSLGETSVVALVIGASYLLIKGYMDWRTPLSYLGTVALFGGVFWLINPHRYPDPLFHLLAGGLMLGALFMATDPVTTPITKAGRWVFGLGAGLIVVVIRLWGGLPEGVAYSILFMNGVTPLINRYTRPRRFGEVRRHA